MVSGEEDDIEREVAGEYNTLRIYIYMLKVKASSSREVQRALDLSSPTLAQHHLEKLKKYGLVEKNNGTYHVRSRGIGILKFYVRSGKWIVPRTIFFAIIFGILATSLALSTSQNQYFIVILTMSIVGLALSLYETARFYRVLPKT